jgi:hypothetical protein
VLSVGLVAPAPDRQQSDSNEQTHFEMFEFGRWPDLKSLDGSGREPG